MKARGPGVASHAFMKRCRCQVTSPSPVASVESVGRRKIGRYLPGTPDALGARETNGLHQVNEVVAQSRIRRRFVDSLQTHRFDFRHGRCRRFGCPRGRRSLRMCRKRPCRSRASEQTDELPPHGFQYTRRCGEPLEARRRDRRARGALAPRPSRDSRIQRAGGLEPAGAETAASRISKSILRLGENETLTLKPFTRT